MSRYSDDRDDDYNGGGRARRRLYEDERYQTTRDYDDRPETRRPGGSGRDYEDDYRREREDYYRSDYASGAVGRRGERADYERLPGRRGVDRLLRYDEDERERRIRREEERDYFRRRPREEYRGGASRSHVRCRDIMTRDVTVATRETTLAEVAKMMRDEDTGVIPVVERANTAMGSDASAVSQTKATTSNSAPESMAAGTNAAEARSRAGAAIQGNGKLVGLITDRDIVVRAIAEGKSGAMRAEEIMTTDVHTAQPNDRVIEAIRKMGDKQVRRIPVVDREGILRGIISMADVALETNDDRELADALEEISSGSSFWNRIFG